MTTYETLDLITFKSNIVNDLLKDYKIIDDMDYKNITIGLTPEWKEEQIFFNVNNVDESYDFAKALFNEIVNSSNSDVAVGYFWDPVERIREIEDKGSYWYDTSSLNTISYSERDSSQFRMYWKYMPVFKILGQQDFVKMVAVNIMLFVFIAIICFSAVFVIAYVRSITIALNNSEVFEDMKYLGAKSGFLQDTIKDQMKKIFFTPTIIGTIVIYLFFTLILYNNDGQFAQSEIMGLGVNGLIVLTVSVFIYLFYRWTRNKIYRILDI